MKPFELPEAIKSRRQKDVERARIEADTEAFLKDKKNVVRTFDNHCNETTQVKPCKPAKKRVERFEPGGDYVNLKTASAIMGVSLSMLQGAIMERTNRVFEFQFPNYTIKNGRAAYLRSDCEAWARENKVKRCVQKVS